MVLAALPDVERLTLARVTKLPEWHPEHGSFEPFPVHAWLVRHPDGVVLIDTGIGTGHELIDEWYAPDVVPLADALAPLQLEPADITAVVLSHLHFDHCGQQALVDAPVYVQRREHTEAQAPHYTIDEWATIPDRRLRLLGGDAELADGVRVVATPGHTPGHQSVVVEGGGRRVVIGGQCAFRAAEIRSGDPATTNLHGDEWYDAAKDSLTRLRALAPVAIHLSHDPSIVLVG